METKTVSIEFIDRNGKVIPTRYKKRLSVIDAESLYKELRCDYSGDMVTDSGNSFCVLFRDIAIQSMRISIN